MDRLLAMRVFVRVVEAGTFTRAAGSLNLPRPTVTKLVQGLESHLRVKLLQRTTRRVSVTSEGATYYERAVRWLGELDDFEAGMANAQASPQGRLRVEVGGSVARLILLPALPAFHDRHPGIQVDLMVSDRTADLVGDNIDCVLRLGPLADQSLVARRLGELSFVTCAAPSYLVRWGRPSHPSQLEAGHQVVNYASHRTGRLLPLLFAKRGKRVEVQGRHVVTVNESNAHLAAALAGLGIIQTPHFMARSHLDSGELEPVLGDWSPDPQVLYIVYPSNRHLSARLRVFVDWLVALFAGGRYR